LQRNETSSYLLRPEREQVLRQIGVVALNKGAIRKKAETKVFKKLSKNTCEIEKKLYFAPASRDTQTL
jgi:hypothetical protein